MATLLDPSDRETMRQRAKRLRADTPARWGRFTAAQMLAHAIQSLGMMTGAVPVKGKRVPWVIRRWPMKHLLIYTLPFPKGLPTAPELLARPTVSAAAWRGEVDAFERALESIAVREASGSGWPDHPAFGPLTGVEWGALQYRHLDHHFRQFGI